MNTDTLTVRTAEATDLDGIAELDALRSGREKRAFWADVLRVYGGEAATPRHVALVAVNGEAGVVGFLFGEIRAWEFGSEPCGWIFSVAVSPAAERQGYATRLCEEAVERFRRMGVRVVRTMVRRNDVPVLSFFRSRGFVGGPFSEMERAIAPEADPVEGEIAERRPS